MPPEILLLVLPFGAAFVTSMLLGPGIVQMLRAHKAGQVISSDGPESHRAKAGTPTMGGVIILLGAMIGSLAAFLALRGQVLSGGLAMDLNLAVGVIVLMICFAALGFVDDYLTIRPRGGVRGIASKPKFALQALLAVAFLAWISRMGFSPVLYVGGREVVSGAVYWVFAWLFIVGMANFVNITDGLDGLVAGLTAVAALAFGLTPFLVQLPTVWAELVLPAIAGASLGFLWFNANPAKVFMGDTGSLAIGVGLPAVAILAHREVLLIVIGMVFVLDGLSSALQWAVFKYTRVTTGTGRRVFKKSPIHHHFELSGWAEQTVVIRFWILGVVFALLGFTGAAMRWW